MVKRISYLSGLTEYKKIATVAILALKNRNILPNTTQPLAVPVLSPVSGLSDRSLLQLFTNR